MLLLLGLLSPLAAAAPMQMALNDSIRQVEVAPQTGPLDPHTPFITRKTLETSESGATMEFEVALKLRNFAELQQRVAHGERISAGEVASKYNPAAADYAKVCDWLTSQGFEITRQEKTRMAVFARGKVSLIAKNLQVTFARVTSEGREYTAAITAPQVPATLAPLLVGINGLQPFILLHTPPEAKPTDLSSTNPPYTPSQIANVYQANGLYTSTPAITGSGQTIAILMDDEPLTTDLTTFWGNCGINQSLNNIQFIQVVSGTLNSADQTEATLDTEWSSGLAPGADVRLYTFPSLSNTDIDAALQQVYTDTQTYPIHQLSMSFGLGEAFQTASSVMTEDQSIALLASAGVTLFASAGDGGSTPSSSGTESGHKLNVEWPSSNPNVTAVGGTSLVLNSNGSVSTEVVWNKNVVDGFTSSGGTGGGLSTFYSRPSWQTGTGVPSGTARCVPDVASAADPATGAYLVLNGAASSIGGTSWSSPSWAGFCALINQYRANAGDGAIGLLGPDIYPLIGTANFRDITSGNNATNRSGSTGGVPNYTAGTGYDLCTGIGVPNVQTLAQTLSPANQQAPEFTDGPPPTTGTVGTAYSFTYTASGSPAPTFSVTAGNLPTNLNLNSTTGVISGTPTASGVFTGTVTASNGISPTATQNFTITVNQAPTFTDGPPPSTATVGTVYNSFTYTASGSPAPTFSVTAGSLPTNLNLNSTTGVISGTPTASGIFTGTVTASNGVSPAATQNFTITVNQAPAFTDGPPPSTATVGTVYNSFTYTASGSPAPTFSVTAGNLPTNLNLNSTTGVISGTPTASGIFTGTVTASNGVSPAATQNFTITVNQAPAITSGSPPANALTGNGYSFSLQASGYPAPTFSVTAGALPAGLSLSPAGVLSGIPTVDGVYTFTISASNGVGSAATQQFTITVTTTLTDTPTMPPWGLAILAALFLIVAARSLPKTSSRFVAHVD